MKRNTWICIVLVLIIAVLVGAITPRAQQAVPGSTPVQQVQPFTTCNQTATATSTGNGAATVTMTPPAGQFVYICSIYISEAANALVTVGAGPAPIFTTTNLQNNLVWWGDNSALAQGVLVKVADEVYPLFLKSQNSGTAFTIVTSAGQSTQNVRINVTGFFAP